MHRALIIKHEHKHLPIIALYMKKHLINISLIVNIVN